MCQAFSYEFAGAEVEAKKEITASIDDRQAIFKNARQDDKIFCSAALSAQDLALFPEYSIWLADVYVLPPYRGGGIAVRLICEVEQLAVESSFYYL